MQNQESDTPLTAESVPPVVIGSEGLNHSAESGSPGKILERENESLFEALKKDVEIAQKKLDEIDKDAKARLGYIEKESARIEKESTETKQMLLLVVVILLVMVAGIMIDHFATRIEMANDILQKLEK